MMYRFPSTITSPTLEAADAGYLHERGQTYRARIGSLDNSIIGVIRPDDGDTGLYYVCHGPATRATGPAMPFEHNYCPGQTYSFYEAQLASSPASVAQAALNTAQTDLYYANTALGKFTPLEAGPSRRCSTAQKPSTSRVTTISMRCWQKESRAPET